MDSRSTTSAGTTSERTVDVREEAMADAKAVADTAKQETRSAIRGINDEIRRQTSQQKARLSSGIREIGEELDSAAQGSSGSVAEIASEAATRARRISSWVDTHEPSDVLSALERYARRRPFMFVAGATAAGALVGRFTRNAMASRSGTESPAPTGTGQDRGYYSSGMRSDPNYPGSGSVIVGDIPEVAQTHQTLPTEDPLSQRSHDPQSAYPSSDQPAEHVGAAVPPVTPQEAEAIRKQQRGQA